MSIGQIFKDWIRQRRLKNEGSLFLANEEIKNIGKRQIALSFVPHSIVAGSVEVGSGSDPAQIAYNSACLALDSERVCLIFSKHGKLVHYIAGLSSDFSSSHTNVTSLLAIALPGMPHHQGNGCYQTRAGITGDLIACVACKDGRVYSFVGTQPRAERFPSSIGGENLPLIDLGDIDPRMKEVPVWKPHSEHEREENKRLMRLSGIFLFAVNLVMGVMWIASIIIQSISEGKILSIDEEARRSMSSLIVNLVPASYKNDVWNEYQLVSIFVREHKGKIDHYELKEGLLSWQISVPNFVSGGEINSTFKNVTVSEDGFNIIIKKGIVK